MEKLCEPYLLHMHLSFKLTDWTHVECGVLLTCQRHYTAAAVLTDLAAVHVPQLAV